MVTPATEDRGFTAVSYFDLVRRGLLDEDDRVELLEGLVVSAPPQGPLHASVVMAVHEALREAVGHRASIRVQMPLVVGARSVPQDRLTKSRIYAAAGIPEYWIVNLRDRCLEIFTKPDVAGRLYLENRRAGLDETIVLAALADASVAVAGLLPGY